MSADPFRYFRIEARTLLDELSQGVLDLERGNDTPTAVSGLLRVAHTLKGAARVVKQATMADIAHAVEEVLGPHRDDADTPLTPEEVDGLLRHARELRACLERLDAPVTGSQPVDAASEHGRPRAVEAAVMSGAGFKATSDDVDALLAGIGAAAVESAALRDNLRQHDPARLDRLTRELGAAREAAERLRLLPAGFMFVALEILARDAAQGTGKELDFVARGADVRLDAEVFGVVQQALVQAVRNAVVHGVETSAERAELGKPVRARIVLEVVQRGREAVFVCRDDGRGVDTDAVRRALAAKGMPPQRAASLSHEEVLSELLGSHVSTASSVTQHAGRGIGLDVVREVAARVRGRVTLESQRGIGTALTLIVPVSVSAVSALIVEAGGVAVALPLSSVKRALRVQSADLMQSTRGAALMYEGSVVPFAPLSQALRQPAANETAPRCWSAVIVEGRESMAAIGVARLNGTENLVVRALPEDARADRVVAGASLTAQGHPQLLLDPAALVDYVRDAKTPGAVPTRAAAPVLVIDDSLTTRMLEQSILESAGYDVDVAVCAEDGLTQAYERNYALFLVDVDMPGIDGFTFVERIRADPRLKETPAILVTSRNAPEDLERGRRVGAQDYIVKGEFDQGKLLERIRTLIGAR